MSEPKKEGADPEILKSYEADGKKYNVVKSRGVVGGGKGVFETVYEETDRGVKQVPLSQIQILEEYKRADAEFRRIRYQKVVKSGHPPNPSEEIIRFFEVVQRKDKDGNWASLGGEQIVES